MKKTLENTLLTIEDVEKLKFNFLNIFFKDEMIVKYDNTNLDDLFLILGCLNFTEEEYDFILSKIIKNKKLYQSFINNVFILNREEINVYDENSILIKEQSSLKMLTNYLNLLIVRFF